MFVLAQERGAPVVKPASLTKITTVDERYQSYNIEMLEVTGGRFWKPYGAPAEKTTAPSDPNMPAGLGADLYAYRGPKDLSDARLRKLAAALGPAYLRVSGTWANTSYFPKEDEDVTKPPSGFSGVLTRAQWKGVVEFSQATGAEIVTSFATSMGTRDANGVWTTEQAQRLLEATAALHGRIAGAEYMNEPTFTPGGGVPKGYTGADFGRDFRIFRALLREKAPEIKVLGPGSVGETVDRKTGLGGSMPGFLSTPTLLEGMGDNSVDVFSYHAYGGVSKRCAAIGMAQQSTPETAFSEAWLARTDGILEFYRKERDEHDPGKPMWLTETAETACGGNLWASTFLDSFRYLDQLGRLAKQGVKAVMHNTLAASDYALLDEKSYEPRPNYWAALLWRKEMGTTVLESGVPLQEGLHVYAHCLRDKPGGVAVLVIQTSRENTESLGIPMAGRRYTLSAAKPEDKNVMLNGHVLTLGEGDALPKLVPVASKAGRVDFAPETISFLEFPEAGSAACR